eukprot:375695_1
MKVVLLLLTLSCISVISKVPKKWANKDDKSLYCNICENIVIDVEKELMEHVSDLSGTVSGYKLDSKGARKKKTFSYELEEEDIDSALDNVCSSWGTSLGTSKQSNGKTVLIKSSRLEGSFSGSLNFGGDAASKATAMCKSNVKKQRKNMVSVLRENDYDQVQSFCKDYVSKKCPKITFKKDLAKQIKALGTRGVSDEEEGSGDEEIQLMEDDDEDEKRE